jgi:hypothetical protein
VEQSSISTAAIQTFLDAAFRSAAQVGFVVMIGDEGLHPVTKTTWLQSFRNFVLKHAGKSLGSSPGRRPANARGAEQKCFFHVSVSSFVIIQPFARPR